MKNIGKNQLNSATSMLMNTKYMPVANTVISAYSIPVALFLSLTFSKSDNLKDARIVPRIANTMPMLWVYVTVSFRKIRLKITVMTAQDAVMGLITDILPICRPLLYAK